MNSIRQHKVVNLSDGQAPLTIDCLNYLSVDALEANGIKAPQQTQIEFIEAYLSSALQQAITKVKQNIMY